MHDPVPAVASQPHAPFINPALQVAAAAVFLDEGLEGSSAVGRRAESESGVLLDRLLDRAPGLGKVLGSHDRMNLNTCIECEKPGLCDGWDL